MMTSLNALPLTQTYVVYFIDKSLPFEIVIMVRIVCDTFLN